MSIPYPGDGIAPRSQNDDHLSALATRYIEEHLDDEVEWDEVREHLQTQHGRTGAQAAHGVQLAVLDLEWTGAIQYDTHCFRQPGRSTDAHFAPLPEVAEAVLGLGWPRLIDGRRSRSVHECFLELDGRYRHCDVYWAMHELLKGTRLACHRRWWSLLSDTAILADPSLTLAHRAELEQVIEAELCERYVATLEHRVEREYPLAGRRADIFDLKLQRIIEAKAYTDDVVVLGAITQAMLYRTIANHERELIDRIAVLLPGEPSALARQVARHHELEADVIWWNGASFTHQRFE